MTGGEAVDDRRSQATGGSYLSDEIASLCRQHGIRRKILVAPSRQAGYNLSNWIASSGLAWANLVVETPQSLAERLARPQLESQGLRRLSPDEAFFLVHDAIEATLESMPAEEPSTCAPGPGLTRTVSSTVESLRLGHVGPSELDAGAGVSIRKLVLARAYRGYLERIKSSRAYDTADVFDRARALVGESVYVREAVIAVLDEVQLPAVAHAFMDRCREACTEFLRVGRPDFEVDPPSDVVASRFAEADFAAPPGEAIHPAGQIRAHRLAPESHRVIQIRDAVGTDAEVRGVFREIIESGHPLDQIEVVYTDTSSYAARIATVADHLGVPIRFGDGLPVYLSRPGQAILGYFRWLAGGLEAGVLIHLLRSGLISFGKRGVSAMGLAEVLESRRARDGRDGHLSAVDREQVAVESRRWPSDEKRHQRLAQIQSQRLVLADLLGLVGDESRIDNLATAGLRFLNGFFRHGSERDASAVESITDRLHGLVEVKTRGRTADLAEVLVDLIHGHRIGISAAA
ncbi:MAG: hypothetical protein R3178_09960, partial [Rhodothermales bacterium]|nr:hypothetical protein [Rhodothermales bacterium]